MGIWTILGIAVALAMDAFAVAVATGCILRPLKLHQLLRMSCAFGLFQALMPLLGWLAGAWTASWFGSFAHLIAFFLLLVVAIHMAMDAMKPPSDRVKCSDPCSGLRLFMLALATSIDAFALGVSLGMLYHAIWLPILVIGLVTLLLTAAGMLFGRWIQRCLKVRVEWLGAGIVLLVAIGFLADSLKTNALPRLF